MNTRRLGTKSVIKENMWRTAKLSFFSVSASAMLNLLSIRHILFTNLVFDMFVAAINDLRHTGST